VDLLVEYDPARAMTMFQFMDLEEELATLFPGLKVEVVSRNGLSPYLRDSILSEARVLYERWSPLSSSSPRRAGGSS
jgi:predicted nucleotidyltransferase